MPLPRIKTFCTATCKATGVGCLNPAAFGMPVCRYHGARKPQSVARGKAHGQYIHGERSQAGVAAYRAGSTRLRALEDLGFKIGLLRGPRTPGRRAK